MMTYETRCAYQPLVLAAVHGMRIYLILSTAISAIVAAFALGGCGFDAPPESQPTATANPADSQSQQGRASPFKDPDVLGAIATHFRENEREISAMFCQRRKRILDRAIEDAPAGDAYAHWSVANWYGSDSCIHDPRKAAVWMERAAMEGVVTAPRSTGMNYLLGRGVLQNPEKAHAYLSVYAAVSDEKWAAVTNALIDAAERPLNRQELEHANQIAQKLFSRLPAHLIGQDEFERLQMRRIQENAAM